MNDGIPSPYIPQETAKSFKIRLKRFLDQQRVPHPVGKHEGECGRDCHMLERNYILAIVKEFLFKED